MHAFHDGQTALVESWLRQLEGEPLERRPGLAVLAGWIHALRGRPRDAEECLAAAERGIAMAAILDDTTVPRLALLRAALCPDGVERMQADAQFAVDSLDLLSPWRAKALLLVGWSQLLRGMDDAADTTLTDAARASAAGLTNTSSIALAGRAVLACARGDLVGADGLATEGIERLISRSLTARATSAVCYAVGARTAAERGATTLPGSGSRPHTGCFHRSPTPCRGWRCRAASTPLAPTCCWVRTSTLRRCVPRSSICC